MDLAALAIAPRIEEAETLPGWAYASTEVHELSRTRLFPRAWLAAVAQTPSDAGAAVPLQHGPGVLDEPLVLIRQESGELRCLSNVCTHRGMVLVGEACQLKGIRCPYHGRRFGLDGTFRSMPEFARAEGFPRPGVEDLTRVPLGELGPLVFASLDPWVSFVDFLGPLLARTAFVPWETLRPCWEEAQTFQVQANWALYCENYLEGFHIPYVHPGLASALDYSAYRTELFEWGSLQVGVARPGELSFDLPPGHCDEGQEIAAYYYWLFPNTMLNVYPWGVSLNLVEALSPSETRVRFVPFLWRPELRERGAGADLGGVEAEDEAVVEAVQVGVRSRLYTRGRYSPSREQGVHHFHRLLSAAWRGELLPPDMRP